MAQSPKRNWRLESKNRENTLMKAREIIIETLLKEAADKEKLVAQALNTAFSQVANCLLYTSPSPRDRQKSRMPSSA